MAEKKSNISRTSSMESGVKQSTRRGFLKTSLAAGGIAGGFFVNPNAAARPLRRSPNESLNIACVGVGNKGWHNVEQLAHENIVALCDVDKNFLGKAAEKFSKAKQYSDYRELMNKANSFDAVVVSTADHMHAPVTAAALALGKNVYCEKPLTHTVAEARYVAELAKQNHCVTQMGTQIHAGGNYRRVVELIQGGTIGNVTEVHCWCNKGWSNGRFKTWDKPVPANLDWNLWLGAAQDRPYSPDVHPANWRRFWEYGSGTFGDMACHVMDLPFWALGLRHPKTAACVGPELHQDGAPSWTKATFEFPKTENHGELTLTWSDGNEHFDLVKTTTDHGGTPLSKWGLGVLFVGDKGMLAADYGRRQLLPQDKFADVAAPEQTIPDSIGHWKEWTEACKTGSETTCNFDYSGALTETVLLGVVAFRCGEKLNWDADKLVATNHSAADEFVNKEYREGFEIAGLG